MVGGQVAKGPSGRRKDVILSRQERGQRRRASGRNSRQIVDADRRRGAGLKERSTGVLPQSPLLSPLSRISAPFSSEPRPKPASASCLAARGASSHLPSSKLLLQGPSDPEPAFSSSSSIFLGPFPLLFSPSAAQKRSAGALPVLSRVSTTSRPVKSRSAACLFDFLMRIFQ